MPSCFPFLALSSIIELNVLPRLSTRYQFAKPNDQRALDLMNASAKAVLEDLPDLMIAYGVSDEFR